MTSINQIVYRELKAGIKRVKRNIKLTKEEERKLIAMSFAEAKERFIEKYKGVQ